MTRTRPVTSASFPQGGPVPPLVPLVPMSPPPSALRSETLWPRVRIIQLDDPVPFRLQRRWWWFPFWTEERCFTHLEEANRAFDELVNQPRKPVVIVIREE